MQDTAVTNSVRSTTNYDQFDVLGANRYVNKSHVQKLIDSMEADGNFTQANPILVNERMQVVDGQHRLEALKTLGLPVFYTQVPSLTINEARKMNLLHKRWDAKDFLRSYAEEGREAYVQLTQLREEYPRFSMATLIVYAVGHYFNGFNSKFRRGELETFDIEAARERLDQLLDLCALSDAFYLRSMTYAALQAMNQENYDHGRMVRKVTQLAADIRPYQGVGDNLRQLEWVYNEGHSANRVRLF